jgi:hypothetical protein
VLVVVTSVGVAVCWGVRVHDVDIVSAISTHQSLQVGIVAVYLLVAWRVETAGLRRGRLF